MGHMTRLVVCDRVISSDEVDICIEIATEFLRGTR
jgi:hypothetical protein